MRPLRVLVVDDEEGIRYAVSEFLRRRGDDVTSASDGQEALDLVRQTEFDILLTDLMMPVMGGLELIRETRRLRPRTVCLILTGHGSRSDAIEAVREGVFEFIEKPVLQLENLAMAIDRAGGRARLLCERERLMADLQRKNARLEVSLTQLNDVYNRVLRQEEILEADLRQAQRMQKRLLPQSFPPIGSIEFFGYFCPCERLGGDFFGMIPLADGRQAIYLADVAGHGVGASMVTVILRELIHAHRILHPDSKVFENPAQALAFINKGLSDEEFDPPVLVTMVYAVVDGEGREICCACAGHPAPIVCRSGDGAHVLNAHGPVLGIRGRAPSGTGGSPTLFGDAEEFLVATTILEPGDSLVLYSDGLTEARDGGGNELGVEALADIIADNHSLTASDMGEEIESALFHHVGASARSDDMTFLVAGCTSEAATHGPVQTRSVKIVRPDEFQVASPKAEGRVSAGWTGNSCVVRLTGKVTWQQGHALQQTFGHALDRPAEAIHVDMAHCHGIDSTIIGILFQHVDDFILHGSSGRIDAIFEEMGVLAHFRRSDQHAPDAILTHVDPARISRALTSNMMLRAHESLMDLSDENRDRFGAVVEALRKSTGEESS